MARHRGNGVAVWSDLEGNTCLVFAAEQRGPERGLLYIVYDDSPHGNTATDLMAIISKERRSVDSWDGPLLCPQRELEPK